VCFCRWVCYRFFFARFDCLAFGFVSRLRAVFADFLATLRFAGFLVVFFGVVLFLAFFAVFARVFVFFLTFVVFFFAVFFTLFAFFLAGFFLVFVGFAFFVGLFAGFALRITFISSNRSMLQASSTGFAGL